MISHYDENSKPVYVSQNLLIKVDGRGVCVHGEDANFTWASPEQVAAYVKVADKICERLIAEGRCPVNHLR